MGVEEKGIGKDPMRSNYMANIGLLLDSQAKLNIRAQVTEEYVGKVDGQCAKRIVDYLLKHS